MPTNVVQDILAKTVEDREKVIDGPSKMNILQELNMPQMQSNLFKITIQKIK